MEILRTELVEAQKARTDFIRWKLLFVGTLGAIGLGLTTSKAVPNAELVLCCIPFVCAYVDTMCLHFSLRVVIIGEFLRRNDDVDAQLSRYESFVDLTRTMHASDGAPQIDAFALQNMLIPGSTLVINIALLGLAVMFGLQQDSPHNGMLIGLTAALGIGASMWIEHAYQRRKNAIRDVGGQNAE